MYSILAMGYYISYTILDFPDLTVEGTVLSGGITFGLLVRAGMNPWLAMLAAFAVGFTLRQAGTVCGLPWAWLCNGRPVARRPGCEMALPLSEPGRIAARLEQGWVGADLRPGPAGENLLLYPAGPLL